MPITATEKRTRVALADKLDSLAVKFHSLHLLKNAKINNHADKLTTAKGLTEACFTCWCGALIEPLIWRGLTQSESYYTVAENFLTTYLGLDSTLRDWAITHPDLWGNIHGATLCTVYDHIAFGVKQEDLTPLHIAVYLTEVSLRIGAVE